MIRGTRLTETTAAKYGVQTVAERDLVLNATACATAQDGSRFPVCTTIQYVNGSESGSRSGFTRGGSVMMIPMMGGDSGVAARPIMVTVQPQATTATQPTKTPEQMQQEAEQSGGITIWHQFSWWYPWYRLHLKLSREGQQLLDVGLSALGDDVMFPSPTFNSWINNFMMTIVKSYIIGWAVAEIAILIAMQYGATSFVIALAGSVMLKAGLLALAWNSVESLRSSFIGAYVSFIIGAVGLVRMLHSGLVSLASDFITAASATNFWKFLYKFIYIPINLAFMLLMLNRLSEQGGI